MDGPAGGMEGDGMRGWGRAGVDLKLLNVLFIRELLSREEPEDTETEEEEKKKELDFQTLFVLHFRRMIYNPYAEGS